MGRHGRRGIFKDTSVSTGTWLYRMVFSRSTGAVLGSALAARWLSPYVRNNFKLHLPGVSLNENLVSMAGSGIVGLGLGYGTASTLNWIRMRVIAALLDYKGWMFNQKAMSTKFWGIALKLLVGPGPHKLHDFDEVMPHLPVPELKNTCDRFLMTVQPLLTQEEYQRTERLVKEFLDNDGPILQEYIRNRAKKTKNWLAEWWMTDNYLARREPTALNVNFFMMGAVLPEVSSNTLARFSNILHDTLLYYEMMKDGSLPPDMVMDMIPTCMDGVRFMLASTRIPGEHMDRLQVFPDSTHIVVISNGVYFKIEMYPVNSNGKRQLMNKHEIREQVRIIWEQTKDIRGELPVAVLTAQNRTKWAKDRAALMTTSAETLSAVESAILIISMGTEKPETISGMAMESLAGNGHSRWFDKSLLLEAWKDVAMGGGNMEHSGTDATHFAVMWEHVLQLEEYGPDGDLRPLKPHQITRTNLPEPQRLRWNLDSKMTETVQDAYASFKNRVAEMDLIMWHSEFGRSWMKSRKVSPDGFIQMAIQLAFWRIHGYFTKTYEPASHRLYALGRTDNINPVSEESIKFMKAMHDSSATSEQKVASVKDAINFQNRVRLEVTAGQGCDRHMLGLYCAARELGRDIPDVFTDKAFNLPMRLSTSQVPTSLGHLGLDIIPESIAGGFGPACEDGYGVLYVSVGEDMFNFSISTWRTCPETDSGHFADMLCQAMRELRDLLDGKDIPVYKTKHSANL